MKKIILVGASSEVSKHLYKTKKSKYSFIRMSRDPNHSDVENFDLLNEETYFKTEEKIDGLVYFPGTINLKQFHRLSLEDFNKDLSVNVKGAILTLKYYYKNFNLNSSVVLFSSVAAKQGMAFHSSVSVSKNAVIGLMISLASEWSPKIRVNAISPSIFKSKMSEKMLSNEKAKERIGNNHPLKKTGSVQDISSMVDFLISEDSGWITGQDFSVDGGISKLKT